MALPPVVEVAALEMHRRRPLPRPPAVVGREEVRPRLVLRFGMVIAAAALGVTASGPSMR